MAGGPSTSARAALELARSGGAAATTATPSARRPSSSLTTTEGGGGGGAPTHSSVARSLIVDTLNLVSVRRRSQERVKRLGL